VGWQFCQGAPDRFELETLMNIPKNAAGDLFAKALKMRFLSFVGMEMYTQLADKTPGLTNEDREWPSILQGLTVP